MGFNGSKGFNIQSDNEGIEIIKPRNPGLDAAGDISSGIGGSMSLIGVLRGQDLMLMIDRTSSSNGLRRDG